MKFLFGLAFGVVGMWAYQSGKLQSMIGGAPAPVQQVFSTATDRLNQVASSDQVRQVASTVQDKFQQSSTPNIVTPTAAEIAGRPAEPLPRYEPEGAPTQNS